MVTKYTNTRDICDQADTRVTQTAVKVYSKRQEEQHNITEAAPNELKLGEGG